jgi:hypothetical protein
MAFYGGDRFAGDRLLPLLKLKEWHGCIGRALCSLGQTKRTRLAAAVVAANDP